MLNLVVTYIASYVCIEFSSLSINSIFFLLLYSYVNFLFCSTCSYVMLISVQTGSGSTFRKKGIIVHLMRSCREKEMKFLVRTLVNISDSFFFFGA